MDAPLAPTGFVTGTDFVMVTTSDLDAAREFYGNVLDLPCSSVWQRGDSPAMGAEFETGSLTIALMAPAAMGREHVAGTGTIALRVDDVAAAKATLEERGVEFTAPDIDSGVCQMAYFQDPDGNSLMLHHRYAPLPPRTDLRDA